MKQPLQVTSEVISQLFNKLDNVDKFKTRFVYVELPREYRLENGKKRFFILRNKNGVSNIFATAKDINDFVHHLVKEEGYTEEDDFKLVKVNRL